MKHKFFSLLTVLPVLALALAPLNQAKAILINPESFGDSQVQVSAPGGGFAYTVSDREAFPVGDPPKNASARPRLPSVIRMAQQHRMPPGHLSRIRIGRFMAEATRWMQPARGSVAGSGTELSFTLLESGSYSVAASFDAFFVPNEFWVAEMFVSLDRFDPFGAAPMESGATVFIGISSGDVTRKCTFVETSQGVVVEQLLESGVLSAAPRVEGPPRENPGRYT